MVATPINAEILSEMEELWTHLNSDWVQCRAKEGPEKGEIFKSLVRDLHSLKGIALSFGFSVIGFQAGQAEAVLKQLKVASELECQKLASHFYDTLSQIQETLRLAHAQADLQALVRENVVFSDQDSANDRDYAKWEAQYQEMVFALGQKVGKRMALQVRIQGPRPSILCLRALDIPLVHLLRNAADHGIEYEASRLLAGKPSAGLITLDFSNAGQRLTMTLTDDGAGIDRNALGAKALQMGLIDDSELKNRTEQDQWNLILLPELSIREHPNAISGNGIGMEAVSYWIQQKGGSLKIASAQGHGTQITLDIPNPA